MYHEKFKIVAVGDSACGKTSLLRTTGQVVHQAKYGSVLFDNYVTGLEVDNILVDLVIWDEEGKGEFDKYRPMSYFDADAALLCFSVDNPDSLCSALEKWHPELGHCCPDAALILVGNKIDLRNDNGSSDALVKTKEGLMTTTEDGWSVAKKIKASAYVECSAESGLGVEEVFQLAAVASLKNRKMHSKRRRKLCYIL